MIIGCQKEYVKKTYYETGELKEKIVYDNKQCKINPHSFHAFKYYKNGKIQSTTHFREGQREGDYIVYYLNGQIKSITNFKNNEKHGVEKLFSKKGDLIEENFYLSGDLLIKRKSIYYKNKILNKYSICPKGKDCEVYGRLIKDYKGKVEDDLSIYYSVIAKDTINLGEKYILNIEGYSFGERINMELFLGDINKNFEFIDTSEINKLHTKSNHMKYAFRPSTKGYNLLTGILYFQLDTLNSISDESLEKDFIFYHEFYVKDNN